MLAFDIDGTLLRSDGSISQRTFEAIDAAREQGYLIVVATGRPWLATSNIAAALGEVTYAACLNGTVVVDVKADQVLHSSAMSVEQACETARLARRVLPQVRLAADLIDGRHMWDENFAAQMPPEFVIDIERVARAEDAVAEAGIEVLTWMVELEGDLGPGPGFGLEYRDVHDHNHPDSYRDADRIIEALAPLLNKNLSIRYSGIGPAEIAVAGVSKASALEWISRRHNIKAAEVMAFGDGLNDLEMLVWVGHSVAMANGHEMVRRNATRTTLSNDEDGVAVVLEELLASEETPAGTSVGSSEQPQKQSSGQSPEQPSEPSLEDQLPADAGDIVLSRIHHYRDTIRSYEVQINGQFAGRIRDNNTEIFSLGPGKYRVRLRLLWIFSPWVEVEVPPKGEVRLRCGPNGGVMQAWRLFLAPMTAIFLEHDSD